MQGGKIKGLSLIHIYRLLYTPEVTDPDTPPYTNYEYEYATGMKTGSTSNAGGCLIATAQKDGRHLIALIFGDASNQGEQRWTMARKLFEYGFNEYSRISMEEIAPEQMQIDVANAPVVDNVAMKLKLSLIHI